MESTTSNSTTRSSESTNDMSMTTSQQQQQATATTSTTAASTGVDSVTTGSSVSASLVGKESIIVDVPVAAAAAAAAADTTNSNITTSTTTTTFDSSLTKEQHNARYIEICAVQDDRSKYEQLKMYKAGFNGTESAELYRMVATEIEEVSKTLSAQCSNEFSGLNLPSDSENLDRIINEKRANELRGIIAGIKEFLNKWDDGQLNVHIGESNRVLVRYEIELQNRESIPERSPDRVTSVAFSMDNDFIDSGDLEAFESRVEDLFQWHSEGHKTYLAPYFPIIQSSGTGKTRLLREYEIKHSKEDYGRCVILVLCTSANITNEPDGSKVTELYKNHILQIPDNMTIEKKDLVKKLSGWVSDAEGGTKKFKKVVFLIDEAHHLLEQEGIPFRTIRRWLRLETNETMVAVFAGTNSGLANYYPDPKKNTTTRDAVTHSKGFYTTGTTLYDPFFEISTMGLLRRNDDNTSCYGNDYENAICYGRPLFTLLHRSKDAEESLKEATGAILKRMLLSQSVTAWEKNEEALLSILATRVQMGQTSASVVSTLVSLGYANLTFFSSPSEQHRHCVARYCYFTDPVCARLAMCLMDEKWDNYGYTGRAPKFWTEKALKMFANGMCAPNKGDLGEVAAAFYLLFCGDILRKATDNEYNTFGISFQQWLSALKDPGPRCKQDVASTDTEKVSFIQFSRLHFRLPWTDLLTQEFLKELYMSGSACFLYPACPVFDMVASIRQEHTNEVPSYKALMISVKARKTFGATDVKNALQTFDSVRNDIKMNKNIEDPCCMLVLIGADGNKNGSLTISKEGYIVLRVSHEDPFGVTNLVLDSTDQNERCEIYSSHWFMPTFASRADDTSFIRKCLRSRPTKTIIDFLTKMLNDMNLSIKSYCTNKDTTDSVTMLDLPNKTDENMGNTETMMEECTISNQLPEQSNQNKRTKIE